jgi:6-phosphogluconolactonase
VRRQVLRARRTKVFRGNGTKSLARVVAAATKADVARRGFCRWALCGGDSPLALYRRLARPPYARGIPWDRVHVYWTDERLVPPSHPDSNFRLVDEALLSRVPLPPENVHRLLTERGGPAAARAYDAEFRGVPASGKGAKPLDLVVLGVGEDGHVASLFPGSTASRETSRWAVAVTDAPKPPRRRVTLTLPALNRARRVHLLFFGARKAAAWARVSGRQAGGDLPAQRVRPVRGELTLWADRAAAGRPRR